MISYSKSYRLQYFSVEHFKQAGEKINHTINNLNKKYKGSIFIFIGGLSSGKTNKRERKKKKKLQFSRHQFFSLSPCFLFNLYWGKTTSGLTLSSLTKKGKHVTMFSGHEEGTKNISFLANHVTPLHSILTSLPPPSPSTLSTHPPHPPSTSGHSLHVLSSFNCLVLTSAVLRWRAGRRSLFFTGYWAYFLFTWTYPVHT